jgi:hypothetical protein
MAAGSRGVDGGSNGDGGEPAGGWRAEEAIAGNRMALQALRELVVYPFLYARESRLLGLKVLPPVCSPPISAPSAPSFDQFLLRVPRELVFCSGPEDCCSTAPLARER